MTERRATRLPNPERVWHALREVELPSHEELVARVCDFTGTPRVLSGGLANLNLDLGDGRVLRIYLRDASPIPIEVALMGRSWTHLRVPEVLASGDDFILMEHVAHTPTLGSGEHGRALGRALAEIHAVRFESGGFLAPDAKTLVHPFSSTTDAYAEHVRSLDRIEPATRKMILATLEAERAWLDGEQVLLHGDFKVSNLHVRGAQPLVLDWECTYAGPPLMDIGQLFRWGAPNEFSSAFARGYVKGGGALPEAWRRHAARADLVNLAGLLDRSVDDGKTRVLTDAVHAVCV